MSNRSKVSIEDLLRLKRAERPASEFWSEFDREMRQKQLSALLEHRSWWQGLAQFFARRAYLPLGAAAILTFTFVSVRYLSPAGAEGPRNAPLDPTIALNSGKDSLAEMSAGARESYVPVARAESFAEAEAAPTVAPAPSPAREVSRVVAVADTTPSERPSARSIAATLARLEQSEPDLFSAVLGGRLSSPARARAEEPVVEMASLSMGGSKRSRLLAQYSERHVAPEPSAPEIVRERLSRRLGDSDFNDRFSRVGVSGGQVSLKF